MRAEARFLEFLQNLPVPSKLGGEIPGLSKIFRFRQNLEARFQDFYQIFLFRKTWRRDSWTFTNFQLRQNLAARLLDFYQSFRFRQNLEPRFLDFYKLPVLSKPGGETPGLLPKLSIPSKHGGETPGLFKNFHFHQELEARFLDLIQRSGFVKTWMKDSWTLKNLQVSCKPTLLHTKP